MNFPNRTHFHPRTTIFFSLILIAGGSLADECTTYACTENSRLTSKLRNADRQLNIEYKDLIQKLNRTQKVILVQEQRKWINFRDTQCEKFADESCHECDFSTSSQIQKQANDELWCIAQLTKTRTQEIQSMKKALANGTKPDFSFIPT
ncbi:MAG TPA: lysozyme inhibitor LprI family protein [Noviherbaspirillum sp.]|uniref:lysozyme inhibitor LprI family protein n=1 Tax=Noviherbaspirillum sp. TaxID=1926288 RepID=UPI002B47B5A6|nr:lysozyme inhibitor LprI family protein [Noviherbaspirillum sp.]HJV87626.1 lysozyme inhibitor LprI family protein [Noviherbaspirillum sp.]